MKRLAPSSFPQRVTTDSNCLNISSSMRFCSLCMGKSLTGAMRTALPTN